MIVIAERQDIGLSNFLYGLGAGLFFVGYFVAQLPSNVIVTRVGAPRWLALLLFTWGLVTMCTAGARSHPAVCLLTCPAVPHGGQGLL